MSMILMFFDIMDELFHLNYSHLLSNYIIIIYSILYF